MRSTKRRRRSSRSRRACDCARADGAGGRPGAFEGCPAGVAMRWSAWKAPWRSSWRTIERSSEESGVG